MKTRLCIIATLAAAAALLTGCAAYNDTVTARQLSAGLAPDGKSLVNYRVEYR